MPQKRRRGGAERRKRARTEARLSMRLESVLHEGGSARVVTESQNISSSGVYCRSSHFLAPYSKVDLTIVLPRMPGVRAGNELLKCEGIVVRCDPAGSKRGEKGYQLACMFSGLEQAHRDMLEDFVTWRNLQSLRAAAAAAQRDRPARSRASATKSRSRAVAATSKSRRAPSIGRRKATPRRRAVS
jgi:hypothetical protein